MDNLAIQIVASFSIAAFSAWVTVQLSLRRYRSEKWWDRRAEAYSRVIEALYDTKTPLDEQFSAEVNERPLDDERLKWLEDRASAARDELARITSMGAFLLCDQALHRLSVYQAEEHAASETTCWQEYLYSTGEAADRCITDIIQIAKNDLRIRH